MTVISQVNVLQLLRGFSNVIPRIEAEIIVSFLLKCDRLELYVGTATLSDEILEQFNSLVKRRLNGEPLQYITGTAEFMGRDFQVNKNVLIPRPETEFLVEEILLATASCQLPADILDLCTGSGNIAITLAYLLPDAKIIAIDLKEDALRVARQNSIIHKVDSRIKFYKGDLFKALLLEKKARFDIIVCNPPYIKRIELESLQKEVRFEPRIALDGGTDGLEFYKRIAKDASYYLKRGGLLFLELGFDQADDVKNIFKSSDNFEIIKVKKDFAGIDRVLVFRLEMGDRRWQKKKITAICNLQSAI